MTRDSVLDLWEARCINKSLTAAEIKTLISDAKETKDYSVISYVCASAASHPNVTLEILEDLFNMDNPMISAAVLANAKTPKDWLKKKINFDKPSSYKVNLDNVL